MGKKKKKKRHTNAKKDDIAHRCIVRAAMVFTFLLGCAGLYQLITSLIPLTWRSVECRIVECQLTDSADRAMPFSATVLYEFDWQGKAHQSRELGIDGWTQAADAIQFLRSIEHASFVTRAYLPTNDPQAAVLLRPAPRWGGVAFLLFGSCFTWLLFFIDRYRDAPPEALLKKILPSVALLFGGAGLFLMAALSIPSWIGCWQIQTWEEIPATIVWSEVRVRDHGRRTKSHADICYEYERDGRRWRNNRITPGIVNGTASRSSAHALMHQYRPGMRTTCRIHPTDPAKAYLISTVSWHILFTLFPAPFIAVGYLCLREMKRKR